MQSQQKSGQRQANDRQATTVPWYVLTAPPPLTTPPLFSFSQAPTRPKPTFPFPRPLTTLCTYVYGGMYFVRAIGAAAPVRKTNVW